MNKRILAVILTLIVGLAIAVPNNSTLSNPNAKRTPADPNAPAIVRVPVPKPPVTDAPPPFGTVIAQYNLTMSGGYAGSGITNRRDISRIYCMDQAAMGGSYGVFSYDGTDPEGTWRNENWVIPTGWGGIPWGLAWDPDSMCFWISFAFSNGGCHLARMDTLGHWMGRAQDTWDVSPLMTSDWMGGMDKWPGTDTFWGLPVNNTGCNVRKFNPYTKTYYGAVPVGASYYEERGATFLPYDSLYIVTTGWYNMSWRKRDTNGTVLQDIPATVYGPCDNTFWVPDNPGPDDTCFFWGMNNDPSNTLQKLSAGILWSELPSVNRNTIRPTAILSPTGTMDSGQTTTPRLVIRNSSTSIADLVKVTFTVQDPGGIVYIDSTDIINMPAKSVDTIDFTGWVPQGRDSMSSVAWVYWAGDSMHKDDTIRNRFLVRVKDIAVTELIQPHDTLDSGAVITPQCRVWNYGNQTQTFDVRFRIGAYTSTRTLTLMAGGATVVAAPTPYTAEPGIWLYQAYAVVTGDLHPENNLMQDTIWVRGTINHDVGVQAILSPAGFVDTLTTVTPSGRVKNFTGNTESFQTFFTVTTSGGTLVYCESLLVMIGGNDSTVVSFPSTRFTTIGAFTMACSTAMTGDQNSTNDVKHAPLTVVPKLQGDVGIVSIIQPSSYVPVNTTITPTAKWKNYSDQATSFVGYCFLINPYSARVYTENSGTIDLAPFAETTLTFADFNVGTVEGRWIARCSTFAGDTTPGNDVLEKPFTVASAPPWPAGWKEVAPVPVTPSGKFVKDGGWVTNDAGTDMLYVAKGNKTPDFYSYDPNADVWTQKSLIPMGIEAKQVYKGAFGAADGNGLVYATKGNNTTGFWMYDAALDSWYQKPDVPLGVSGKKVKGGTGLQYANGFVYTLKGYKNEFYKFDPTAGSWITLPEAPIGANQKWDKGSWIVYDGSQFIYAHKAKYMELWKYDVIKDSWVGQLTGMPLIGSTGKSKKSKDGGSAAWMMGKVYAFKGGNTTEFWRYTPEGDSWRESDTIPAIGSAGRKKKIKAGAGLATFNDQAVFGLKGNKCAEFWRFVEHTGAYSAAPRQGVMAGSVTPVTGSMQVGPNPMARGFATLRYSLPQAGLVNLRVYDVTGRSVLSQTLAAGRNGSATLDLRKLNAGIYMVKVVSDNFSATQKLVVQK